MGNEASKGKGGSGSTWYPETSHIEVYPKDLRMFCGTPGGRWSGNVTYVDFIITNRSGRRLAYQVVLSDRLEGLVIGTTHTSGCLNPDQGKTLRFEFENSPRSQREWMHQGAVKWIAVASRTDDYIKQEDVKAWWTAHMNIPPEGYVEANLSFVFQEPPGHMEDNPDINCPKTERAVRRDAEKAAALRCNAQKKSANRPKTPRKHKKPSKGSSKKEKERNSNSSKERKKREAKEKRSAETLKKESKDKQPKIFIVPAQQPPPMQQYVPVKAQPTGPIFIVPPANPYPPVAPAPARNDDATCNSAISNVENYKSCAETRSEVEWMRAGLPLGTKARSNKSTTPEIKTAKERSPVEKEDTEKTDEFKSVVEGIKATPEVKTNKTQQYDDKEYFKVPTPEKTAPFNPRAQYVGLSTLNSKTTVSASLIYT